MNWAQRLFSQKCPRCGERQLRMVNFIRATVMVNGHRAPDSWSFYNCEACSARLKLHSGQWSDASEAEWQRAV